MYYQLFKYVIFVPLMRLVYRARIEGEQNLPATGGAVLASNHVSAGDTLLLPAMIRRRLTFPAKAELFRGDHGLFSKLVAWFLKAIGQVPLDRSGGRVSLDGLGPVLGVLREGGLVGIYPEGTRSPDGRLYKGKTGVARMALAGGVPVIPVAMVNTKLTKKLGLPWMERPLVRIGRPMDFHAYEHLVDDRNTLRWITDEVMNQIMLMSGQTYVEAYGTSLKSGSLSAAEADARVRARPGEGATPPVLEGPAT